MEVSTAQTIHGIWVRGHNGHVENERCDILARNEAEKLKKLLKEKE